MIRKVIIPILFIIFTLLSCADPEAGSDVPEFFNAKEVSAGLFFTAAIKSDGTLWTWGSNEVGLLGIGSNRLSSIIPIKIGDEKWKAVSIKCFHIAAIKNDDTLWAWGYNPFGQLGVGDITNHTSPVKVDEPEGGIHGPWIVVSAGGFHTAAIKSDGTLWAWGDNSSGQLGDGSPTQRRTPVQVKQLVDSVLVIFDDVEAVSTGYEHTVAIKRDGSLYAWGYNVSGLLGVGDTTNHHTSPVKVDEPEGGIHGKWIAVSAGRNCTLAIKADGTLWAWGSNTYGQLGLGDKGQRISPEQVGADRDWEAVSAGLGESGGSKYYTLATKTDGTLWAWGDNTYGQLGLGDTVQRTRPVKVGDKWKAVSAGALHAAAIRKDGVLWAWGNNNFGQLGDATNIDKSIPARVILSDW